MLCLSFDIKFDEIPNLKLSWSEQILFVKASQDWLNFKDLDSNRINLEIAQIVLGKAGKEEFVVYQHYH